MKVQVIGLGTVGFPTAFHVSRFFDVVGYDVSREKLEKASKLIPVSNSLSKVDVYVVIVGTGINRDGTPDVSAVFDVCAEIASINSDALVAVESTVAVGTCRRIAERFGFSCLVHCPHRFWSGDPLRYGVAQKRILGALNEASLQAGEEFYSKLDVPVHVVSSLEVAELAKITENAYRFVEIAFAESVAMTCEKLRVQFGEVKEACNSLKRPEHGYQIQILEANSGVGGHCLPKDLGYLLNLSGSELLEGAILTDKSYRLWCKRLIEDEIKTYV